MHIKHVFFDLDHTLWDFETNSAKAYSTCFKEMHINLDIAEFLAVYTGINEAYWKRYREDKVSKETLKYGRLKDSFTALSYDISDDDIHTLASKYIDNLPKYNALFEGGKEALIYLSKSYELHIITNGFHEIQRLKLQNAGIRPYFNQVITSESAGVKKPNPEIFYYALKKAGAKASESMMIGDSYEADVQGALEVGMQALYFNPHGKTLKKTYKNEIKHLNEIKKYL